MKLETLRKRREFLRVRGGGRWATHAFVMETRQRTPRGDSAQLTENKGAGYRPAESSLPGNGPRFGFTVTKRHGNAVKRNRIRRRLKAAIQAVAETAAKDHFDYVIIARAPAHDMTFAELTELVAKSFERVHQPPRKARDRRDKRSGKNSSDRNPEHKQRMK